MNNKVKELDQFFTNPKISDILVEKVIKMFPSILYSDIIESSVGSGNFVNSLLKYNVSLSRIKAYDIDLSNYHLKNGIEADYLATPMDYKENRFVIGNPPFGRKGKLALDFLNKALIENDIVAFILPKTFERYSIQKKVISTAKLVYQSEIEKNSFLVNNREYDVNCVFQIWINKNKETYITNKRIVKPKSTKSNDFMTFIHNNTQSTLKYFDKNKYNWDFAVHRQGFYDYTIKITDQKNLVKNRQYLFVKINDPIAEKIFSLIDFNKLARKNTTVKGFSLTDLIEEYEKIKLLLLRKKDIINFLEDLLQKHNES